MTDANPPADPVDVPPGGGEPRHDPITVHTLERQQEEIIGRLRGYSRCGNAEGMCSCVVGLSQRVLEVDAGDRERAGMLVLSMIDEGVSGPPWSLMVDLLNEVLQLPALKYGPDIRVRPEGAIQGGPDDWQNVLGRLEYLQSDRPRCQLTALERWDIARQFFDAFCGEHRRHGDTGTCSGTEARDAILDRSDPPPGYGNVWPEIQAHAQEQDRR